MVSEQNDPPDESPAVDDGEKGVDVADRSLGVVPDDDLSADPSADVSVDLSPDSVAVIKDEGESEAPDNVVRVDFAARAKKRAAEKVPKGLTIPLPPSSADMASDRPEKLRMFARLAERGMVMVTLDARPAALARVPVKFQSELQLNLNFSHRFGLPDFGYDDDGLRASLSFGGTPFFCDIPWTAVYGMTSHVDGERLLWPDSFPQELVNLLPAQARAAPPLDPKPDVVDGGEASDGGDAGDDDDPPPRPTLRRIK